VLQRLNAIEQEQHAAPHHGLGNRLGLGGGAGGRERDTQLGERPVEEFIRRGRALLAALAVERPAEHRLGAAIVLGLQALEPFVYQCRFAGAALGDEREDVGVAVGPGRVEACEFGIAADQALVGGFGEAGDVDKQRKLL
jgi:hypothetical protein